MTKFNAALVFSIVVVASVLGSTWGWRAVVAYLGGLALMLLFGYVLDREERLP